MPSKKDDGAAVADNVLTLVTSPLIFTMTNDSYQVYTKFENKCVNLPQDIVHVNDIHAHFDEMSETGARCTMELSEANKGARS